MQSVAVGFEPVGDIPPSGWWPAECKPADRSLDELDHDAWHDELERVVRSAAAREDKKVRASDRRAKRRPGAVAAEAKR